MLITLFLRKLCLSLLIAGMWASGFVPATCAEEGPVILREFIYNDAPFPSCHASTLAETPKGLVAAWFGGTQEKHPDVGIWFSRQENGAWTVPVEVANGIQYAEPTKPGLRYPCWNPVLFQMPGGPLLLFYKVGPNPSAWWGMLMESQDGGVTWSLPRRLPEDILGPVKNKPVLLADGRLLCPTSSENDGWRVHFEWTSDAGRTWTRVPAIHDGKEIAAIQPSILRHADGSLQAVGRTKQGFVFSARSKDEGRTWQPPELLTLPNPNSGTDAETLTDGRQLLIYNHTPKGRTPLNLAISKNGQDWEAVALLETEPGEYSYPALIQTADGKVHITYTWQRKKIRHLVVDPTRFQPRPFVNGQWPKE